MLHTLKKSSETKIGVFINRLTMTIAVIQGVVWIPQIIKILQTQNVSSISIYSIGLLWMTSLVWLTYGIYHGEKPIIISAGGSSICIGIIVISTLMLTA